MRTLIDKVLEETGKNGLREHEEFPGIAKEELKEIESVVNALLKQNGDDEWCSVKVLPYGPGFKLNYNIKYRKLSDVARYINNALIHDKGWEYLDTDPDSTDKNGFIDCYR